MVTINNVRKVLQRVNALPLYLHTYAFHLDMQLEGVLPTNLLDITGENSLRGVKIHVPDDECFSLGNMDDKEFSASGDKARRLNLDTHIETGASDRISINEAVAIALKTGTSSVRFYPYYEGNLRDVLSIIANDIAYVRETYQDSGLTFTIRRHEDLGNHELVSPVEESGMESFSLLFNFTNMINANERPIDTLKTIAPHITQIHIKDALIVKELGGPGHEACISGQDDIPFGALLTHLIYLGNDEPQVTTYDLEEEAGYYAPTFRLGDEDDNPWIPYRQTSEIPLPENHLLGTRLRKEKEDAINQINHVRNVLQQIKQEANHLLNH